MTLLFIDGFDHYATADLNKKWDTVPLATYCMVGSAYSRSGEANTQGLRLTRDGFPFGKTLSTDYPTLILGFALNVIGLGTPSFLAYTGFLDLLNANVNHIQFHLNTARQIEARRAGVLLGTTTKSLGTDMWHYVEFKVTIHDTAGSIEIRIDGETDLNLTSQDTQNGGNASINNFQLTGNYYNIEMYFDDLYVCDTAGAKNNNFLGDVKVDTLKPNGAGNYSQWTPSAGSNYENVDEAVMDGDTTYNSTNATGNKDSYALEDLSTGGTIHGIQTVSTLHKDDAGTRTVQPFVRVGSTDYNLGNASPITDSYSSVMEIAENNPADSQAWEEADINALESGIELVS